MTMQPIPSVIHFMPIIAATSPPVTFSTGGRWYELPAIIGPYTAGIFVLNLGFGGDQSPICRLATFRCFPRAVPISQTFQMRLFSYYYDAQEQRVYDDDWPVMTSAPNMLGNVGVWVHDKLNAMAANNATWQQYNIGVKVMTPSGVQGQLFGARLELQ